MQSDAYMRQEARPSLTHIMACRLVGAKPLSDPKLDYCQLGPREQISVKLIEIPTFSFQENVFENTVWEVAAILPRH